LRKQSNQVSIKALGEIHPENAAKKLENEMRAPIGKFNLILHSHLPYVLNDETSSYGETWLFEAVAESYIPILNTLNRLVREGYSPRVTLSISPVLLEQLGDDSFPGKFSAYLEKKILDAANDRTHFLYYRNTNLGNLARMWQVFYDSVLEDFEVKYNCNILAAFKKLQDDGFVEIIATAATHAYLPLLSQDSSIDAQVKQGISAYERVFGKKPKGFWLPEFAYRPSYSWTPPVASKAGRRPYMRKGMEEFLSENGISYFFTDSHLLKGGKSIGIYLQRYQALRKLWGAFTNQYHTLPEDEEKSTCQAYKAVTAPKDGQSLNMMTRDPNTALQIWHGEWGFPGDPEYLDFFKRYFPGRHRYWKVTSSRADLADKIEYDPLAADSKVAAHAESFIQTIRQTLALEYEKTGKPGILSAPFDSELFGHWWFEGPKFLYLVLKGLLSSEEEDAVALGTGGDYLQSTESGSYITLPEGSWGEGGFHYIWLNEWTYWMWKHIYDVEVDLQEMVEEYTNHSDPRIKDVLKQCARELLMLQSSDWPFYLTTWTARDFVEAKFTQHHQNFIRLSQLVEHLAANGEVDFGEWNFYQDCSRKNRIFPDIELEWFRNR